MKIDRQNLYLELVRNRTRTLFFQFGYRVDQDDQISIPFLNLRGYPPGINYPQVDDSGCKWIPADISKWWFSFSYRKNFTREEANNSAPLINLDPIVNLSDGTLGFLVWEILDTATKNLAIGNYVFSMSVITDGKSPRFFCSGASALIDNTSDTIAIPTNPI